MLFRSVSGNKERKLQGSSIGYYGEVGVLYRFMEKYYVGLKLDLSEGGGGPGGLEGETGGMHLGLFGGTVY